MIQLNIWCKGIKYTLLVCKLNKSEKKLAHYERRDLFLQKKIVRNKVIISVIETCDIFQKDFQRYKQLNFIENCDSNLLFDILGKHGFC